MRFMFLEENQMRLDAANMFKLYIIPFAVHNGAAKKQVKCVKARFNEHPSRLVFKVSILSQKP